MKPLKLVASVLLCAFVGACGPSQPTTATQPPANPASVCITSVKDFRLAILVPGSPDSSSAAFLADQQGLFDAAQFSDPLLYPPGYHWKIDTEFQPGDLLTAQLVEPTTPGGQWSADLVFNLEGTGRIQADGNSPQGAGNKVAFFTGKEVLAAPDVPATVPTSITLVLPLVSGGQTPEQRYSNIC